MNLNLIASSITKLNFREILKIELIGALLIIILLFQLFISPKLKEVKRISQALKEISIQEKAIEDTEKRAKQDQQVEAKLKEVEAFQKGRKDKADKIRQMINNDKEKEWFNKITTLATGGGVMIDHLEKRVERGKGGYDKFLLTLNGNSLYKALIKFISDFDQLPEPFLLSRLEITKGKTEEEVGYRLIVSIPVKGERD